MRSNIQWDERFYQNQLTQGRKGSDYPILTSIPYMVSSQDNQNLTILLIYEKEKQSMIKIDGTNASRPDGLTRKFFQISLTMIGFDVFNIVKSFFD